ncbi:ion channel [uncultured Desulfobacter sp.]|uniref:ion channel n=1 Tax=uncultured Desulfobacter sp. TaxID=240139 RepID=UPI002AAC0E89|nr:ion channel [uncultured Desulfobacter sp.]
MLNSFFKLNGEFKRLESEDEFLELIRHADALRDLEYRPNQLRPDRPMNKFSGKKFTNISFAKTEFIGLEFSWCEFIDCLFIGTIFIDCEFHDCTFSGCNPHKVRFKGTYIDPICFSKMLSPTEHANIGTWLFQQLLRNSAESRQPSFAQTAQYYFQKWKRYQLWYDYKQKNIPAYQFLKRWIPSLLYDHLAGYGIRILPLVRLTAGFLLFCTTFNHYAWRFFGIHSSSIKDLTPSVTKSIYYTVITVTTLGYGDLTPTSEFGMNTASVESLFGVVWLGLFANTIIKRVTK